MGLITTAQARDRIVVPRTAGWSDLLWEKGSDAATVYNDVRATVAALTRYRTNLIVGRPITTGPDS